MSEPEFVSPRVGILDVAARAGVSRQTVTRAMNGMPGISEATREHVLQIARELRYRPSRFGRGLVTRGVPTLGLVVVDLTNSFWAELASEVLDAASRHGWTVLIVESAHGGGSILDSLVGQVDAVIGHLEHPAAELEEIFGALPLVLFERELESTSRAMISLDFGAAIEAAVDHLVAVHRRRIVMLDWSRDDRASRRGRQYSEAVEARGIQPRLLVSPTEGEPVLESGRNAAAEALRSWPDADAFICFNDVVAIGAIKHLASSGMRVPEDIAVVGMDGLQLGLIVTPELTTLEFDFPRVAREAVDLLIDIAAGRAPMHGESVHRQVSPRLTVRNSA